MIMLRHPSPKELRNTKYMTRHRENLERNKLHPAELILGRPPKDVQARGAKQGTTRD